MFSQPTFSIATIRQVLALIIILIIAWLLQLLLWRLLTMLETRFVQTLWVRKFLLVIRQTLLPFLAWALTLLVVDLFQAFSWADDLLVVWGIPFTSLWIFYRLLDTWLNLNLPAPAARLWSRKVLLPILLLIWLLYATNLLDDLFQWQLATSENQLITVGSIITGLVMAGVVLIVAQGVGRFLGQVFLPQAGAKPGMTHALSSLVTYILLIVGIIAALSTTGLNLTTLTVIAGGLSVGLGFGLQAIVNNFVSGFILMFEQSIEPGDIIQIGETRGVVQSIGIRSMTIRTGDNIELIIPNSHFLSETMINLTRTDPIVRVRLSLSVSNNANPREVERALLEAAQHPYILDEPAPTVQFRNFSNNTLNFDLFVWTSDPSRTAVLNSDLWYNVWDALAAHNIELINPLLLSPLQ